MPYVETVEGIMVSRHVGIGKLCQTKGEEEEEEEDCGQELKERKRGGEAGRWLKGNVVGGKEEGRKGKEESVWAREGRMKTWTGG